MEEHRIKDVLDFLLSSYRAKMAIDNPTESCPFDFNAFLQQWKDRCESWPDLRNKIESDLEPLVEHGLFDSILPYLTSSMNQSAANREILQGNPILGPEIGSLTPTTSANAAALASKAAGVTVSKEGKSRVREKFREGGSQSQRSVLGRRDTTDDEGAGDEEGNQIVIHVCDEAKGLREDFTCVQSTLIQEMGYFSKVAVRGQRLKDMDISVHCDISVFDWLMKWVKYKVGGEKGQELLQPLLDATNVIGLMVSADFLQMPTLTTECLQFTLDNIDKVIASSPNLGCLNESLTSRLAQKLDNLDIESRIVQMDKSDRISSRLYTQMIMALNEPDPDMGRGHFASSSSLFRCYTCGRVIINEVASKVPCNTMRFDCRGRLYSSHLKDPAWSLVSFVRNLKKDLKTWRRVYWRLWSTVHFLSCSICQFYFPAKEFGSCRFHPRPPNLSVTVYSTPSQYHLHHPQSKHKGRGEGSDPGGEPLVVKKSTKLFEKPPPPVVQGQKEECINPFRKLREANKDIHGDQEELIAEVIHTAYGSHPCCSKPGYKFYPLPPTNGCQFNDHDTSHYSEDDPIVQRIQTFRDLIVIPPKEKKKGFEWGGISELTPVKFSSAAVPNPNPTTFAGSWGQSSALGGLVTSGRPAAESVTAGASGYTRTLQPSSSTDSTSLSDTEDGGGDGESAAAAAFYSRSRAPPGSDFWVWNPEFTTRYNQDMQREREEKLMADLELLLSQRISLDATGGSSLHSMRLGYLNRRTPKNLGGSYIKLEERWREELQRNSNKAQRQVAKSAK